MSSRPYLNVTLASPFSSLSRAAPASLASAAAGEADGVSEPGAALELAELVAGAHLEFDDEDLFDGDDAFDVGVRRRDASGAEVAREEAAALAAVRARPAASL